MNKYGKEAILIRLNQDVLHMINTVNEALNEAMDSFFTNDKEKAVQVIQHDDAINEMENSIEYDGLACLALFQPEAIDLRFVVGVLKMITDIERIGDLAVNIGEATVKMESFEEEMIEENLRSIYRHTQEMFQLAVDAFTSKDIEKAKRVIKMDNLLDEMNHTIFKETLVKMCRESKQIQYFIQYLLVSRHLERIGDHTTNLAEDTIFIYGGLNIKHHHKID